MSNIDEIKFNDEELQMNFENLKLNSFDDLEKLIIDKTPEQDIINYVKTIKGTPNFDKIITFKKYEGCYDVIQIAIMYCYFELVKVLHYENKTLLARNPHILWEILIALINNDCETKNIDLFNSGLQLFEITYQLYTPESLSTYRDAVTGSPLFEAVRFKTTYVAQMLITYGLNLEARDRGLTPLMTAIINKNFDMVVLFVEAGALVEATAMDDLDGTNPLSNPSSIDKLFMMRKGKPHKIGYQRLGDIWLEKNTPRFPKPDGLNCMQLALALFEHYKKYNLLDSATLNNPLGEKAEELIKILDYLKVEYDIPKFECDICMKSALSDPFVLQCAHSCCKNCMNLMQDKDLNIKCPFCRVITNAGDELKMTLVIATVGKEELYECIGSRTTVSDVVRYIHKKINKFVKIRYNDQYLEITNNANIMEYGLKTNSIIYIQIRFSNVTD
jgi:hypothetical protein